MIDRIQFVYKRIYLGLFLTLAVLLACFALPVKAALIFEEEVTVSSNRTGSAKLALYAYDEFRGLKIFDIPMPDPATIIRASDYDDFAAAAYLLGNPTNFPGYSVASVAAALSMGTAYHYGNVSIENRFAMVGHRISEIFVTLNSFISEYSDDGGMYSIMTATIRVEGEPSDVQIVTSPHGIFMVPVALMSLLLFRKNRNRNPPRGLWR